MEKLISYVTKINSAWSLCAFIVIVIYYILVKSKRSNWMVTVALFFIFLLFLLPIIADVYVKTQGVYRIHVNIIGPEGLPLDNTKIWSSAGGETKVVSSGWEIDVPPQGLPLNKSISIYCSQENSYLKAKKDTVLGNDYNPQITLNLIKDTSALISGNIVDDSSKYVSGVLIYVFGYDKEGVKSDRNGAFTLYAHASKGEQVRLHAEKENSPFQSYDNYFPAGNNTPIVLKRK